MEVFYEPGISNKSEIVFSLLGANSTMDAHHKYFWDEDIIGNSRFFTIIFCEQFFRAGGSLHATEP
jgi:hypothetical protein